MHFFLLSRVLKWKNFLSEIVGDYREYHRKVFELSFFPGNQSCKVGGRRSQRESSFEPFGGKGPTVYWTGQLETPASENQQRLIIKWEERERERPFRVRSFTTLWRWLLHTSVESFIVDTGSQKWVGSEGDRPKRKHLQERSDAGSRGVEKLNQVKANLHHRWPAAKVAPAFSL